MLMISGLPRFPLPLSRSIRDSAIHANNDEMPPDLAEAQQVFRRWYQGAYVMDLGRTKAAPIQAIVDAVADRALKGPTELLPDDLATLLPTPPDAKRLLEAQRMLQKVGITWPGLPAIAE